MDRTVARPGAALKPQDLAPKVLTWWDRHRRSLPWRAEPGESVDPYRVWLSEILLPQTTATGAAPYFRNFVARWPSVETLAAASLDDVMQAFAGLGYYSRARNLHLCARTVAESGGRFPDDEAQLRALPGIGPYTAAAVAAIAYGKPAAPVDGNIARILSRVFGFAAPIPANRAAIEAAARAVTPSDRPGDFAQALMDIGAGICRPRNPDCRRCPLDDDCRASASGDPEAFPSRLAKKARPLRVGPAFYAPRQDGAFLARRRPPKGLLGATMELPGSAWAEGDVGDVGPDSAPFPGNWTRLPGHLEHVFTHFTLRLALFGAPAPDSDAPPGFVWIAPADIPQAGFSGLMRKAAESAARLFSPG